MLNTEKDKPVPHETIGNHNRALSNPYNIQTKQTKTTSSQRTLYIKIKSIHPLPLFTEIIKAEGGKSLSTNIIPLAIETCLKGNASNKLRSSTPIDIDINNLKSLPLDLIYQLQYSHHYKEKETKNTLRISLETLKKHGAFQKAYKTFGRTFISLDDILQFPFNGLVKLEEGKLGTIAQLEILVESLNNEINSEQNISASEDNNSEEEGAGEEKVEVELPPSDEEDITEIHGFVRKANESKGIKEEFYKFKKRLESKLKNMVTLPSNVILKEGNEMLSRSDDDNNSEEENDALTLSPLAKLELQVTSVFERNKDSVPYFILLNTLTARGKKLNEWCKEKQNIYKAGSSFLQYDSILATNGSNEVGACIRSITQFYQNLSLSLSHKISPISVAICGNDGFINDVLRTMVKVSESKARSFEPIVFFIIPIGKVEECSLSQYLSRTSHTYNELFNDLFWNTSFERAQRGTTSWSESVGSEIVSRILYYLNNSDSLIHMPIGEANITYSSDTVANISLESINNSSELQNRSVPFLLYVSVNHRLKEIAEIIYRSSSAPVSSNNSFASLTSGGEKEITFHSLHVDIDYYSKSSALIDKEKSSSISSFKSSSKIILCLISRQQLPVSNTVILEEANDELNKGISSKVSSMLNSLPSPMKQKIINKEETDLDRFMKNEGEKDLDADDKDEEEGKDFESAIDGEDEEIASLPKDSLIMHLFSPKMKESLVSKSFLTPSQEAPSHLNIKEKTACKKGLYFSTITKSLIGKPASEAEKPFTLFIDGVEFQGATFVSIQPQYIGANKSFPIAYFKKQLDL